MSNHESPNRRPICWFEIPVKDTQNAMKFYGQLFGWTFEEFIEFEPDYWSINTGDSSLFGGLVKTTEVINSVGVTLFVHVENIQEVINKAIQLGGFVVAQESVITENAGRHAKIKDLDGNTIGLWAK
ncbi:MAG: VOC family protein [Candidatus Marinimicrobia bacterium]|nr:VOC family protein [Candidatus Neomarinimicrobiota bacterium]